MIARSARGNLTIHCGPIDHHGRRHFTIKWSGDELHHDTFNPFEAWRRAQCAESVFRKLESRFSNGDVAQEHLAEMFGDDPDTPNLTWIGDSIISAANAAEEGEGPTLASPVGIATLAADHPRLAEPIIDGLLRRGETANIIGKRAPATGVQ